MTLTSNNEKSNYFSFEVCKLSYKPKRSRTYLKNGAPKGYVWNGKIKAFVKKGSRAGWLCLDCSVFITKPDIAEEHERWLVPAWKDKSGKVHIVQEEPEPNF